ncbi:hypothetical protein [Luteimonas sp. SDU82]|uniref:hypothetical protein n=1 Tax=Luteimonas sp. SDU82 TaxID=3422592 RepID=UPI003EBFB122
MAEFAIEAEMEREEWRIRQAVGVAAIDELLTGYWITHLDKCALIAGADCDCGLIAWFAGLTKLVAIDSELRYQIFRKN